MSAKKSNSQPTIDWLRNNFRQADGFSVVRSDLYSAYETHCEQIGVHVMNQAGFGKTIRSVFPDLKTRRLGKRGSSQYHYYGIQLTPTSQLSLEIVDNVARDVKRENRNDEEGNFDLQLRAQLSDFQLPETVAEQLKSSASSPQEGNTLVENVKKFLQAYRIHCLGLLDCIYKGSVAQIDARLSGFWRSQWDNRAMFLNPSLIELVALRDAEVYRSLAQKLLPNVLHPLPISMAALLKDYTKKLVSWLDAALAAYPEKFRQRKLEVAREHSAALFKQASLNHLAQAARSVLTNAQQLAHMLDDLTDVELSGLQAQASLVCSCPDQTVYSALCDIHYNIEHAYTLEQWAQWLHALVNKLVADSGQSLLEFFPSFYLRWSLYGSLLVRHLTVKNAVSFGSFHLLRTLFDDYLLYVLEQERAQLPSDRGLATPPPHLVGARVSPSAVAQAMAAKNGSDGAPVHNTRGSSTTTTSTTGTTAASTSIGGRRAAVGVAARRASGDVRGSGAWTVTGATSGSVRPDSADISSSSHTSTTTGTLDTSGSIGFKPISLPNETSQTTVTRVRAGTPKDDRVPTPNTQVHHASFGFGPSPSPFGPSPSPTLFRSVFAPSPAFGSSLLLGDMRMGLSSSPSMMARSNSITSFHPGRDLTSPRAFSPFAAELFSSNGPHANLGTTPTPDGDIRNVARTLAARRSPLTLQLHDAMRPPSTIRLKQEVIDTDNMPVPSPDTTTPVTQPSTTTLRRPIATQAVASSATSTISPQQIQSASVSSTTPTTISLVVPKDIANNDNSNNNTNNNKRPVEPIDDIGRKRVRTETAGGE